jgi:hypothetical protein
LVDAKEFHGNFVQTGDAGLCNGAVTPPLIPPHRRGARRKRK